jgi:PAS domain S-box-containing protein
MSSTSNDKRALHFAKAPTAMALLGTRNPVLDELAAARDALRESNERIRSVLESITDGFAVIDETGRFSYLNSRAAEVFRRVRGTPGELVGLSVWDEFPELARNRVGRALRRAMLEGTTVEIEHYYPALSSWFEIRVYPTQGGLSIYFQDVTRRRNAESLVDFERIVLQYVARGAPLPEVLLRLARAVEAQSIEGMLCSVLLLDEDGGHLVHGAAPSLPDSWNRAVDGLPVGPLGGSCGTAAHERRPVQVSDIAHDARWAQWRDLARAHGLAACTSHPILSSRGEVLGTVAVYYRQPVAPTERDLQILDTAARLAALVIERARSEEAHRRSEQLSRSIVQSSPDCITTLSLDGDLLWISEHGRQALSLASARAVDRMRWLDIWGDATRDDAQAALCEAAAGGTGSFVGCLPVRGVPQWWNVVISPMLDAQGRPEKLLAVWRNVTERVRNEQRLSEETRVLALLNRTGTALASNLDPDALMQAITDAATELSGAQFGAFFYNVTGVSGRAYRLYTLSGAPRAAFEPFGQPRATGLFGPVFNGEGVVRCDDVHEDARYGRMAPHFGVPKGHPPVRSFLAVPVASRGGEVLGGLFFGHAQAGMFDERIEALMVGVAAQAAVAIDNARLYQAAQRAAAERDALLASERVARTEAERANRLKDEFLATLSHELRTPLSSILGWAHILRSGRAAGADVERGLDVIERNARAQAQLIDDLLDMSRIISGKLRLDIQHVAPASFIEAAVETVRPAADAKEIRLETVLDGQDCLVAGDAGRMQQVVCNLLSNAIKFTPKGGRVRVVHARRDAHVEIKVTDTGIGIDPRFLAYVFDRFSQADSSSARPFGGLGLGLAIVRHLIELHGGSVRASSDGVDQGATFTVTLPVAVDRPLPAPQAPATRVGTPAALDFVPVDLAGLRILVVDDHDDARELIARVLGECRAEVVLCASAAEALEVLERRRPAVIVSDIAMPEMDGYEFLRRVRGRDDDAARIPAIALTAFARSEDRTRALRAGFLAHLAKPVEPSELVASIASAAGRFAS